MLDLGTGDGKAVLRLARQQPQTVVIGIDTNAAALIDASRKAPVNAMFLVADALDGLRFFEGRAHEVHVMLPWGSLLRRVVDGEREFALAVAGAL